MKSKILIADDHVLFNDGIKNLLQNDFDIVSQVYDGKFILESIQKYEPSLVLLDINLPSINGFEIARQINDSFESVKVIFLTMYNEQKFINQAKDLKVQGYMLKHSTKEELILAIENVLEGQTYFDKKLNIDDSNLHKEDYFVKMFALTPREVEIIRFIKSGKSSIEIAKNLFLAEETVKTHRKNIHFKLGIKKVSELIEFAQRNGI